MNWYIFALLGAIIWGVHYPLIGKALDKISLMSVMLLTTIPMVVAAPFFYKTLAKDFHTFIQCDWTNKLQILAIMFTSISATMFVFLSIGDKNATLASLIEISFPVFVAIFSYVLFGENQINPSVILGSILVFAGVGIIIFNNT